MSIEVKRSCNSSVRLTQDRINFNCITIALTGSAAEEYHAVTKLYPNKKDTEILEHLIAVGILRNLQYLKMKGDEDVL